MRYSLVSNPRLTSQNYRYSYQYTVSISTPTLISKNQSHSSEGIMSQDFYSSNYNMGGGDQDQWSQQGGWSQEQNWNTSQPYSTPSQPEQPQYSQPQYSQQQYSQYSYSQPQESQQQSFYATPGSQDQYSSYSSPSAQQYSASEGNQSFYSSGASFYDPNANMGSMGAVPQQTSDSFEDEPPLMEELEIDLQQIYHYK